LTYDQRLAARIRVLLKGLRGVEEKKMFGGVGFLIRGNMSCGVYKQDLIVRVAPAEYEIALRAPHARVFDISGRPMKGWLLVGGEGCKSSKTLRDWVNGSVAYARSLPPK
jgi:TfoX N-terminal domain